MAEAFLIAVAKSVGSSLASYAQEQLLLSWGLDDQVQKLRRTMETINAFLKDAEEREGSTLTSHTNQLWVSNLCNAVYDADDVFDEIVTIAGRKRLMEGNAFCKEVKLFFSSSNPLITSFSHAIRIKSIRENLDAIAKDRNDFGSGSRHLEGRKQVESNYLYNNIVVGREDEKDMLMSMLLDSKFEDNVCVIPIVGVGGLGKSTLARYVFNDAKVKANFKDLHLWVPLLQGMSLEDVIEKIIASHEQNGSETIGGDYSEQLSGIINGKKYIIVLDNVWNENITDWRYLETLLTHGAIHGSRILLTTRSPIIAKNMGSEKPFELKALEIDHSWSLLEGLVFGKNGCHYPDLKEIALQILPMSYNVPLAIVALANVLKTDDSVSFWRMFKSDRVSNLGSHGNDIMPILKLSYDYLRPSALKSCFSYCSLFPKGHEFNKNKLVIFWIAQGFVAPLHEGNQLSLEEEGAKYLDMLVYKGLLQDVPNDKSHISSCKLHDLMYELSCSVSAGQCKILNANEDANEDANIERNIRHVSINYRMRYSSFKIPPLQSAKQIRTLISINKMDNSICTSCLNSLMQSFLCLRVLDLHGLGIRKLSEDISNLMHLRYLDLSRNDFERLPNSITSLYNLQYLNLSGRRLTELPNDMDKLVNLRYLDISKNVFERLPNSITSLYNLQYLNLIDTSLTEWPKDMDKLVNLRHLLVDWERTYFPSGFGKLRNLQKLDKFIAGFTGNGSESNCGRLSDLKSLNHLRGALIILIGFYKNIGSDAKEADLKGKKNITCLRLDWEKDRACYDEDETVLEYLQPHNQISVLAIDGYKGNKMPRWMSTTQITSSLQNLTFVRIVNCNYITHVASFSRLPFLESLRLVALLAVEYIESSVDEYGSTSSAATVSSSSSTVFFPSLTDFDIESLPNLKGWREHGEGNLFFPCVSEVMVRDCKRLESLPSCPNVKTLSLGDGELSMNAWWALKSLRSLKLCYCRSMKFLPRGIGHLTMLQSLTLSYCDELEAIPDWIGNICSLSNLEFWNCTKLASLPEEMTKLTQLKLLYVRNCPQLEPRLEKNGGEDWHKIQHIQDIDIIY